MAVTYIDLAKRRNSWILRNMHENLLHKQSLFITLTYEESKNPITLVKKDLQGFIKRVRNYHEGKNRYYACGEYGDRTLRPHYHLLLFGECSREDISRAWPFGFSSVGSVTQNSIRYCTKYIGKNTGTNRLNYEERSLLPPFSLQSRRNGLGYDWILKNKEDVRKFGLIHYGRYVGFPPRYYQDKIWSEEERKERYSQYKLDMYNASVMRCYKDDLEWSQYCQIMTDYEENLNFSKERFINQPSGLI